MASQRLKHICRRIIFESLENSDSFREDERFSELVEVVIDEDPMQVSVRNTRNTSLICSESKLEKESEICECMSTKKMSKWKKTGRSASTITSSAPSLATYEQ
jgi:hypothetical protein